MFWLLIIFLIYWTVVEFLSKRGILEKYGMKSYGPILMIRTKRGLNIVEKISKLGKFWRIVADFGLPVVFLSMVFMVAIVVVADYVMLISPPEPSELTSPQAAFLIPGINPFIPLVWGLIGLIVTLVVHELSHAIISRVEGIKVKSLGLIVALVPLGAFAEPDETELFDKKTRRISRIRVFSIGVISNFIVALIAFLAFFHGLSLLNPAYSIVDDRGNFLGRVVELNGVEVKGVTSLNVKPDSLNIVVYQNETGRHNIAFLGIKGVKILDLYRKENKTYPAEIAGIKRGMMITKIDGTPVLNFFDFNREMSRKKPNQVISVEVYDLESGEFKVFNLTLVEENGRAFMGVIVTRMECIGGINFYSSNEVVESLRSIPASLDELAGWLLMISLPFTFQGFTERGSFFDTSPVVLWFLDSLYWIAWINLWVGLFNCLPAIPLDGGRVFHETFSSMLARRFGDKAEKVSMRIAKALSVFIFLSLAMMILISTLRHLGL